MAQNSNFQHKTSLDKTKEDKFIPKPNAAKTGGAGEKLKQSIVVGHIRGEERSHRCVVAAALHNNFGVVFYAVSVQKEQGSSTRNQFSVAERSIFQEFLLQCISSRRTGSF